MLHHTFSKSAIKNSALQPTVQTDEPSVALGGGVCTGHKPLFEPEDFTAPLPLRDRPHLAVESILQIVPVYTALLACRRGLAGYANASCRYQPWAQRPERKCFSLQNHCNRSGANFQHYLLRFQMWFREETKTELVSADPVSLGHEPGPEVGSAPAPVPQVTQTPYAERSALGERPKRKCFSLQGLL